jgi:cytochrome o ubiquinol oxidase subunit I
VLATQKVKQRESTQQARPTHEQKYEPIEMPKNSACGVVIAFFSIVTGFAMIWHIWWMASVGTTGIFLTVLAFAFRNEEEIEVSVEQIVRFERANGAEITV